MRPGTPTTTASRPPREASALPAATAGRPATPPRRGAADPVKALMHQHRALCARAVDPLEIAAGLCRAHGLTDRAAARYRHRDVFSLAEEMYARVPRDDDAEFAPSKAAGYGGALHELDQVPVRAAIGHPRGEPDDGGPAAYPYPDGCGQPQQADVRTARDRLGWRPRINLEESLADIWMEAACRI
ncbi:hypothetical protein SALBM135S_07296 [Streptomyces alboniger]